jgi:hypothetical protein
MKPNACEQYVVVTPIELRAMLEALPKEEKHG